MGNIDSPYGFRVVGRLGGGVCQYETCYVSSSEATAIFLGDLVALSTNNDPKGRYASVKALASAGDAIFGVCVAVKFTSPDQNLSRLYRPANTEALVEVCTDPNALLKAQLSGTASAAQIGDNADPTLGAGNTDTGISAHEVDSSTLDVTSSLTLRIHHIYPKDDNELGTNAEVVCSINVHQRHPSRTGIA